MTLPEIKRRLAAIKQSQNQGKLKAFVNIDHELDEEIERYKQEHPHGELVIIEVANPSTKDNKNIDVMSTPLTAVVCKK